MTEGEENKNEETSQNLQAPVSEEAAHGQEAMPAEDDFRSLFEESLQAVQPGGVVSGKIVDVNPTHVVVDVGYKTEGRIPVQEFQDREGALQVAVGDDVDVFFESPEGDRGEIVLSRQKAESIKVWDRIEKAYEQAIPIEGTIMARVKGGFKVDVGVDGFLPGSHVDIRPTRNLDQFVGKQDRFTILKYNRMRDNVVVSRKMLLEQEREVLKKETLGVLDEGVILEGVVKNITDFGVFVGVEEGIDGLIHISDLDWTKKIKHPSELYKKGDIVEAKVLGVDPQVERFSLGVKQLTMDPWERVVSEHPVGSRIQGEVVRVLDFGVFVRIAEGVEGLIHVSQLSTEHVDKPSSLHQVGDEVEAEIVNIDIQEHKIGLSIRALKRSEEREELETYLEREKEAGRFSFETILNEELKLDREGRGGRGRERNRR